MLGLHINIGIVDDAAAGPSIQQRTSLGPITPGAHKVTQDYTLLAGGCRGTASTLMDGCHGIAQLGGCHGNTADKWFPWDCTMLR